MVDKYGQRYLTEDYRDSSQLNLRPLFQFRSLIRIIAFVKRKKKALKADDRKQITFISCSLSVSQGLRL